ncbi:MAG: Gfo/Idh/MocA family oxidoreductase [Burkholderiales bacterium]
MIPKLKIGVAGLGRAFSLMVPAFTLDPRVQIVAGADPREEARRKFEAEFKGAKAFDSVEKLAAQAVVDVVYVATPHQFHAAHACLAASCKKHVLVEKPMALSLEDCAAMIAAARHHEVRLIVGHSHSFDAPILRARKLLDSGRFGKVRMIHALNYTDFLYRPRRPEELDTRSGGGVVFNQAAHQVDIVRLLAGSPVASVNAITGAWDAARPTEGAYACQLRFQDGAFASLVYSGYAHFDSDEYAGWIGEMGARKDPAAYGASRRSLHGNEIQLKIERNYGGPAFKDPAPQQAHQHFGELIVSCERADLRPLPSGVMIYADGEQHLDPLPAPRVPRSEVIDELHQAVVNGRAPPHGGEWAMATLEVCLAILRSARERKDIAL